MDMQGGTQRPVLCGQVSLTLSQHHATSLPFIRDVDFTWKFRDWEAQSVHLVQPKTLRGFGIKGNHFACKLLWKWSFSLSNTSPGGKPRSRRLQDDREIWQTYKDTGYIFYLQIYVSVLACVFCHAYSIRTVFDTLNQGTKDSNSRGD